MALIWDDAYLCSSYTFWLPIDLIDRKPQQLANFSETTKTHGQSTLTTQVQGTINIFICFSLNYTNWKYLKQFYSPSSIHHFHLFYLQYFVVTQVTHNSFTWTCLFHSIMFGGMKVLIYCSSGCRLSIEFFLSAQNQSSLSAFLCSQTAPLLTLISTYSHSEDPYNTSCCISHYVQTQNDNSAQHSTPPQEAHRWDPIQKG